MEKADIVIAGAALNGLAAAVALAGPKAIRPLDILVLDQADPTKFARDSFDGRASAITASSRRMLEALGLWDEIRVHAEAMREIIVTDAKPGAQARPALLHFGEEDHGGDASAFMVENRHLYGALLDMARASPAIRLMTNTRITAYRFGPGLARLATDTNEEARASLVVAADGRASPARKAAHIDTYGWSYDQVGIVTTVQHERSHRGRAEEHFLPSGPFAILPLPGNRSSLVWTERSQDAKRIMALDDEAFLAELARRFGGHLGELTVVGPRHAYPLSMQIAQSFVGERLALIGDAAHVIHPIAGLGFNLGLRDVAALAESISEAVKLGLDPGSASVLAAYERWRRFDTVMTAVATDGLTRLFSNDNPGLRAIRGLGLRAAGSVGALKGFFMREAAGETGRLPKLLQGEAV
ncbi:FAD-dependent monooxygenase [Taklimakanibacter lacteus]|uniref:FAD-dependent monooxygenase n=1 Tax=Taklimakanibacter lacteus TaxID=2268456 RepID=UPI000E662B42